MPESASSTWPGRLACAPVKEPFSWPKSSDSISASGNAAQLTLMKGRSRRGLSETTARAASSLPVPLSPRSITVVLLGATRRSAS